MAFPDGWQRRCSVTIPAAQVAGSLSDFPVLLTRDCLPDEMFSPTGGNAAQANGGDVRFTIDSAGTSVLPCEVVQFELDSSDAAGDAEAQVWVKVPSVSSVVNTTFYAWYSAGGGESQPAASDPAGSQAVWADYAGVWHLEESPGVNDSTANDNDGSSSGGVTGVDGQIGQGLEFDTTGRVDIADAASLRLDAVSIIAVVRPDTVSGRQTFVWKGRSSGEELSYFLRRNGDDVEAGVYTGSDRKLTSSASLSSGETYLLGATWQDGGDLAIYINGVEDSSSPVSGTIQYDSNNLAFGAKSSGHDKFDGMLDEVQLLDGVLPAQWHDALNANWFSAATFATPGTPTAADDEGGGEGPEEDDGDSGLTEDTDLEPLQYLFGPIGSGRPVFGIESVWSTTVSHGRSVSEQRYSLQGRPYRRMSMTAYAGDRNESMSMQMMFARMGQRRFLAPLFADESPVTGSLSPGAVTINCTTDYRRFFVGGRVVVYNRAYDGMWPTFAVGEIGAVGANSITLTSGLSRAFSSPAYVAPLIECELLPDISGNSLFFHGTDAQFTVVERVGDMSLPALVTPGTTPQGMTEYGGDPIFDVDDAMTKNGSSGWRREGSIVNTGLGTIPDMYGDRPRVECEIGLEFISRADAWAFLEFAESRAGRAYPFWMLHPGMSYEITAVNSSTSIQVRAFGRRFDWNYRPHIGIRKKDGTIQIRGVSSVSRANGTDTVTLDAALDSTPALADVDRCAPALHARFADDVIEERWQSIDLMRSTISAVELLEEKSIEIAGIDRVETEGLGGAFDATKCPGVQGDQEPAPCEYPADEDEDGVPGLLDEFYQLASSFSPGVPTNLEATDGDGGINMPEWFGQLKYVSGTGQWRSSIGGVLDNLISGYGFPWEASSVIMRLQQVNSMNTTEHIIVNSPTADCVWLFMFQHSSGLVGKGFVWYFKETGTSPVGVYTLWAYHENYDTGGPFAFSSLPGNTLTVTDA